MPSRSLESYAAAEDEYENDAAVASDDPSPPPPARARTASLPPRPKSVPPASPPARSRLSAARSPPARAPPQTRYSVIVGSVPGNVIGDDDDDGLELPAATGYGSDDGGGVGSDEVDDDEHLDEELSWYLETHERGLLDDATEGHGLAEAVARLKVIAQLGWPYSLEKFSGFFPGFMLLVFLGHIPDEPDAISGAGMGFMYVGALYQSGL